MLVLTFLNIFSISFTWLLQQKNVYKLFSQDYNCEKTQCSSQLTLCDSATVGHIVCQNSDKFAHLENRVINSFDSQLASKSVSISGSDCKVGRQNIDKNSQF